MIQLPTLGGNNGVAMAISNRGEVAGFAENSAPDAGCPAPQVLHFKPVVWEKGVIHQLPTGGDPDGAPSRSTTTERSSAGRGPVRHSTRTSSTTSCRFMPCSGKKAKRLTSAISVAKQERRAETSPWTSITKARWSETQTCRATQLFTLFSGPREPGCRIWAHSPGT